MPYIQLFNTKYYYDPIFISTGMTSCVYKGYFFINRIKKHVAIKQINMSTIPSKIVHCIYNEIELLATLDHPNIVKMYDNFSKKINNDEFIYIIFEWLSNCELEKLINKYHTTWSDTKILSLFTNILDAVQYLHDNNIIHRDIKSTNIIAVESNGSIQLKLIDFGFSTKSNLNELHTTVCGSPMFMAPEIPMEEQYNFKADIWSLGIVLFQMKYGQVLFHTCKTINQLFLTWEKESHAIAENDNLINNLINTMIRKNAADRPNISEILSQIQNSNNIDKLTISPLSLNNTEIEAKIPKIASLEDYYIIIEKDYMNETTNNNNNNNDGLIVQMYDKIKSFF
jgi:serine/threonine protein kinase